MYSIAALSRKTRLAGYCFALIAAHLNAAPPLCRVVDLGTLGGPYADANSISEAGHVVGWSTVDPDASGCCPNRHAFLWYDGEMHDLGTLEDPLANSVAVAVNSSGHVVGWLSGASQTHAFLWLPEPAFGLPAGMNDLDPKTVYGSYAWDINERSEIAGLSWATQSAAVFLWLPNPAFGMDAGLNEICTYDPTTPSYNCPLGASGAINDVGQIVSEGYVWLPWPAFGRPAGWSKYMYGGSNYVTQEMSHSGLVVGISLAGVMPQGSGNYLNYWLAEDRIEKSPPEVVGYINGLNDFNDVVGDRWIAGMLTGLFRRGAYLGEGFLNLNDLLIYSDGWHVLSGSDINNVGQIAGTGHREEFGNRHHIILLMPVRPDIDRSGRVDMEDVSLFTWCLEGPSTEPYYECMTADLEGENDIDLKDFQALQISFEGSD